MWLRSDAFALDWVDHVSLCVPYVAPSTDSSPGIRLVGYSDQVWHLLRNDIEADRLAFGVVAA